MKEVADKILDDARKTIEVLQNDRQALWSAPRVSISQRFDYFCQLAPPSLSRPVAAYLDEKLWGVLEAAVGFQVPRKGSLLGGDLDCILDIPGEEQGQRPFAEWAVRQPIRLHGMGLRSQEDNCYPAYVGAVMHAAPFLAKLPALQEVLGGEATWGEDGDPARRLAPLIHSEIRDGTELKTAWQKLRAEAQQSAALLGEDVGGPLLDDIEEAGHHMEGKVRQKIVEEREKICGKLILLGLERHGDQAARPVFSWPERDKHASAWLLCLPSADFQMSSEEFSTAAAAFLCLPPPCCASRIGEVVTGRARVDKWGDNVTSATMCGDGWRTRHDVVKHLIKRLHSRAGISIVCEVFNLFADCIPQAELARIDRGRRRQAIVPDYKLRGERGEGDVLCELKLQSACVSRYPRNPRPRDGTRAVDRRAEGLTQAYHRKAMEVDWQHCGTPRPPRALPGVPQPPRQIGPVERRLSSFGNVRGWVFGAWGECSEEVHTMVQRLAKAKTELADTLPGHRPLFESKAALLSSEVGYLRRRLSFTAVQEQSKLLLDRMQLLGDGAKEARRRREWAEQAARVETRERRAQVVSLMQGHNIRRSGFGLLS